MGNAAGSAAATPPRARCGQPEGEAPPRCGPHEKHTGGAAATVPPPTPRVGSRWRRRRCGGGGGRRAARGGGGGGSQAIMAKDDDLGDYRGAARAAARRRDGSRLDLVCHVREPAAIHWLAASRVAQGRPWGGRLWQRPRRPHVGSRSSAPAAGQWTLRPITGRNESDPLVRCIAVAPIVADVYVCNCTIVDGQ